MDGDPVLKVNLLGDHLLPLLLDDHLQGLDPVGGNGPGQGPGDHTTIQTFSNFQSDDQMSDNVRRFLYKAFLTWKSLRFRNEIVVFLNFLFETKDNPQHTG